MSFHLRILPAADRDVDDIAAYISQASAEQAIRFYDAVGATYELILKAPDRWPLYQMNQPRLRDLRKRAVLRFQNHLVFYRLEAQCVVIVRVLHGARDLPALFNEMDQV
jgi:toxin ParE1/3/4